MQHRGDPRRKVQEMTTKVQAENEKIAQAMKGQAAARRVTAKERATGGIGVPRPAPKPSQAKARKAVSDGILGILQGTTTADAVLEEVQAIQVDHDAGLQEGERPLSGTVEAPKEEKVTKTEKQPRVLEDPVENARLVRMRAKWTAIRRERDVARLEEEIEAAKTPAERKEVSGRMKTAKSVLVEAQVAERKAYKAYRDLLETRQAEKKTAKTASKTAETA